jgi:hypothetical protein
MPGQETAVQGLIKRRANFVSDLSLCGGLKKPGHNEADQFNRHNTHDGLFGTNRSEPAVSEIPRKTVYKRNHSFDFTMPQWRATPGRQKEFWNRLWSYGP